MTGGNETFETDGSVFMERAALVAKVSKLTTEIRELRGRQAAALRALDDAMDGPGPVSARLAVQAARHARIILTGDADPQQARADAVIEEWLQDPERNVFGLAADLLDVISRP